MYLKTSLEDLMPTVITLMEYIYAFPVQQAILALNTNITLFTSLVLTLFFGYLSWQFVEKRALKLKNVKFKLF
jgi:peptidoglycan/LPS O-acetylase OafA/YrhL